FSRTASSIENSLIGHNTDSTDSRSTVLSFGSMFFSPAVSGTRLTGTITFMGPYPSLVESRAAGRRRAGLLLSDRIGANAQSQITVPGQTGPARGVPPRADAVRPRQQP